MNKRNIPFSPPDITDDEINEVVDALKSGWITTGPKTKQFEKEIAQYCHTECAVALNSATAGMELTLRLLGVGPGDEVITSAYTYSASASVIAHVGAKIVLVDIQEGKPEMDYEALENAITDKTKVIIPVDIAGIMCDYDRIFQIVERKRNLFNPSTPLQESFGRVVVMADAAHSFGAKYKNQMSGSVADFTVFSFHAVKNLTTAEGGAVTWKRVTNHSSEDIYKEYMLFALHGQTKDALAKTKPGSWEYDIVAPHYKCNLTDIHAAIGLAQLRRYENMLKHRKKSVEHYERALSDLHNVSILKHGIDENRSSNHLYFVRVENLGEEERNDLIERLAQKGVSTNVHYKPLPMLTAYSSMGFKIENYQNAYNFYKNEITFPLHGLLTKEDIQYIVDAFKISMKEVD